MCKRKGQKSWQWAKVLACGAENLVGGAGVGRWREEMTIVTELIQAVTEKPGMILVKFLGYCTLD